jgi:predicted glycosyltransferase involved in capsule biosynthesis
MIDLSDVTFTIPVKIDQPDRVRNLQMCLNYIRSNFKTRLIISEMDENQKVKDLITDIPCKYIFMKTSSPYFHRTMMLNFMAKQAETPIIVNYDCDVLLPIENYVEAAELIRNKKADMVYPYDGNFYDVPTELIHSIKEKNSITHINPSSCRNLRPEANSVGGAVFWSKQKFIEVGMENENFVSWGYEDNERYARALKLGAIVKRCKTGLFHLHHGSSLNSANGVHPFYQKNEQEWLKVNGMNEENLKNYVKGWSWVSNG